MLPLFARTGRLPTPLQEVLDRGGVVLAANLRAARALQAAYADDQQGLGVVAWPTPGILDWSSWVGELWEQYGRRAGLGAEAGAELGVDDVPVPLTSLQEHQLWKQVQGVDRDRVVAPDRMAELAQEAYELLGSYRAHELRRAAAASPFGETHEDAERFLEWAAGFDRLCQQNGWISRTRLAGRLAGGVGLLDRPRELCLVGFDRTTPAQNALLEAFAGLGTVVSRHAVRIERAGTTLVQAKDQREELEACAWWCREQLVHSPHADGTLLIGVIVPELGRVQADLERVFRRILMPQTTLWVAEPDAPNEPGIDLRIDPGMPYEFSLGVPLAGLPLIRSALLMLRWVTGPLASAELTWLLTSSYLAGSPADQMELARLDTKMREVPEISLKQLLEQARHLPAGLRARLERLRARGAGADRGQARQAEPLAARRQSYAYWAELVPVMLEEAGWPGLRELDSYAYQAQQRWTRVLGELAELGFDGSQPSWSEFLRTLDRHARTVIFAAESTAPPIQILGAFESSGQSFDAVWFMGADDQHWPATGRLHPLLPGWLQRDAGMPHASPEADWLLAQEATRRIVDSAKDVVLSYSMQEKGLAQRGSPLLREHAGEQPSHVVEMAGRRGAPGTLPGRVASLAAGGTEADFGVEGVELEWVADDSGVLRWPSQQSAGGSEVLKRQAACAFQSFAARRLRAGPLEDAEEGLNARDRGTLLHEVLERLWSTEASLAGEPRRLHSHADLVLAIEDGSVTGMVTSHIDAVFAPLLAACEGDPWRTAYLACEQQRVSERVRAWLACELARRPFAVSGLEKELQGVQVGELTLGLRVDRIDTLADGSSLLIDYKTGEVSSAAWEGARPEEPQLPLYALFGGLDRVSGVAFGQVRAEETRLVARAEDAAAQVSADLGGVALKNRFDDEVRDEWRGALLSLADGFVRGDARVNPREGLKTCRYCPLPGLCRVHALDSVVNELEEEEEEVAGE